MVLRELGIHCGLGWWLIRYRFSQSRIQIVTAKIILQDFKSQMTGAMGRRNFVDLQIILDE